MVSTAQRQDNPEDWAIFRTRISKMAMIGTIFALTLSLRPPSKDPTDQIPTKRCVCCKKRETI
jgi:hypothetical protein